MAKARYQSYTKGFNAEVLVAKAVAYTTDADYKTFVANAVEGEIGVFDADTLLLVGANVPLTEGQRFFVAQRRDAEIFKTTTTEYHKARSKKTAYTAPVKQVTTITLAGVIGTAFAIGDEISLKFIETTPGNEPFPTITYDYTVKAGDTVTLIANALVAQINSTTDPRNVDQQNFIVASNAAGVITATAKYFGSSFRVATPGKSYEIATVVYTTAFKLGSGFYDHVRSLENEGNIYDGVTTQYPGDGFRSEEFGEPTKFADSTLTYDIYHLTPIRNEKSPTPVNQHHHYMNQLLVIPTAGGGPTVAVSTILGFTAPV